MCHACTTYGMHLSACKARQGRLVIWSHKPSDTLTMLMSLPHEVHGSLPCQWSRIEINSLIAAQGMLARVLSILLRCLVAKEQV